MLFLDVGCADGTRVPVGTVLLHMFSLRETDVRNALKWFMTVLCAREHRELALLQKCLSSLQADDLLFMPSCYSTLSPMFTS